MEKSFMEEIAEMYFEIEGKSPIIGDIFQINEWIKWLGFKSSNEDKKMLALFKKYVSQSCTKDEFYKVYSYKNGSIENLIITKLKSDEIKIVKEKVLSIEKLTDKELHEKIEREKQYDVYNSLSMIDSYVLHIIIKIDDMRIARDFAKLMDILDSESVSLARLSRVYSKFSKPLD